MRIGILLLAMLPGVPGCVRPPAPGIPAAPAADTRTTDEGPALAINGWLRSATLAADSGLQIDCRMIQAALADTAHSWLRTTIELEDGACVRVDGPGAVSVRLLIDDRQEILDDAGLFVPIHGDASAFLNSSTGPISIRHYHDRGLEGRGIRILIRLPRIDIERTGIVAVEPVRGRWSHHH